MKALSHCVLPFAAMGSCTCSTPGRGARASMDLQGPAFNV